jgi:DNA-binding protein HU-beta
VNKAELVEALAQHYDGSKAEASRALNAVVQTITRTTAAGDKVAITGFGVFEKVERPARMVRNPRTGERKEAAATAVPRFRPGTELKAYVAGQRELPELVVDAAASDPVPARPRTRRPRAAANPVVAQEPLVEPAEVATEPAPSSAPKTSSGKAAGNKAALKKLDAKKAAPKKADAKKVDAKKTDGKKTDGKKAAKKKASKKDVKKSGKR